VLVLFAAPWLFSLAFHGKYPGAIGILPLTLAYCLWFSLLATLQTYALCCEKSYLTSVSLLAGLGVNVGLNLLLLPRFGLPGAVLATTVGNAVALLLVVFSCRMLGFRMDRGTWVVLLLPATFMLGPWPSLAFVLIVALDAFRSEQLLSRDQKALIAQSCTQYLSRFGLLRTAVK